MNRNCCKEEEFFFHFTDAMILLQRLQLLQIYKLISWQCFLNSNVSFYLDVRDAWVYVYRDMFYNLRLGASS